MGYVFLDLPADSSELETYRGYHVCRSVKSAHGGKVPHPFEPATELVLEGTRRPWYEPALMRAPAARGMVRKAPTRAWCIPGFVTWRQAAALLAVPSLCFAMVWSIPHLWA
jgi:hypothetical protein